MNFFSCFKKIRFSNGRHFYTQIDEQKQSCIFRRSFILEGLTIGEIYEQVASKVRSFFIQELQLPMNDYLESIIKRSGIKPF